MRTTNHGREKLWKGGWICTILTKMALSYSAFLNDHVLRYGNVRSSKDDFTGPTLAFIKWLVGFENKEHTTVNHTDGMVPTRDVLNSSSLVSLEHEPASLLAVTESPGETGCETVTTEPSRGRDAFERGTALKRAGLFKQAAAHFEQAAQHPAYAVKGFAQMGLCLKTCGKKEEAVFAFQRAVQVSSGSSKEQVPILYLLGKTLESLARTSEALETYRWIRRENPGYRDVADRIERLSSRRASIGTGRPPAEFSGSWADNLLKTCRGLLRPRK